MELTAKRVHTPALGYGRFARDIVNGVRRQGVTVYDIIAGEADHEDPGFAAMIEGVSAGLTNKVVWFSIPAHARRWRTGQSVDVFTMWEASLLPEAMREWFDEFDQIIVPSAQNVELFSAYHPNVTECHLGLDTNEWRFTNRREGPFFNVLCAGSGDRKAPDLAFEAYRKAFTGWEGTRDGPIPQFIHKSPRGQVLVGADVETVSGRISAEEEIDLYERAHVYLGLARGEGFGLQPLQAMAQGCPTVVTDAHGHKAFTHLCHGVGWTWSKAGSFMSGEAGQWWEADTDEAADMLRDIYANYDKERDAAWEASKVVARDFSCDATATRFLDVVGRDNLGPYVGDGTWHEADPRYFWAVVTRDWSAEIGGITYIMAAGKDYWVHADAKRVLYDCGVLDRRCIEQTILMETGDLIDTGLTSAQLTEHGRRPHGEDVCPTCSQILGSGLRAEDHLLAKWAGPGAGRATGLV